jgi:hypothetical protein
MPVKTCGLGCRMQFVTRASHTFSAAGRYPLMTIALSTRSAAVLAGRKFGRSMNSNYVRVTNPAWNGKPVMRRKDAEYYVSTGRAEWLCNCGGGLDQIRLLESNVSNRAAATLASSGYGRSKAVLPGFEKCVPGKSPLQGGLVSPR